MRRARLAGLLGVVMLLPVLGVHADEGDALPQAPARRDSLLRRAGEIKAKAIELAGRGDFSTAIELRERALRLLVEELGEQDPEVIFDWAAMDRVAWQRTRKDRGLYVQLAYLSHVARYTRFLQHVGRTDKLAEALDRHAQLCGALGAYRRAAELAARAIQVLENAGLSPGDIPCYLVWTRLARHLLHAAPVWALGPQRDRCAKRGEEALKSVTPAQRRRAGWHLELFEDTYLALLPGVETSEERCRQALEEIHRPRLEREDLHEHDLRSARKDYELALAAHHLSWGNLRATYEHEERARAIVDPGRGDVLPSLGMEWDAWTRDTASIESALRGREATSGALASRPLHELRILGADVRRLLADRGRRGPLPFVMSIAQRWESAAGAEGAIRDQVAAALLQTAVLVGEGRPAEASRTLERFEQTVLGASEPDRRLQAELKAALAYAQVLQGRHEDAIRGYVAATDALGDPSVSPSHALAYQINLADLQAAIGEETAADARAAAGRILALDESVADALLADLVSHGFDLGTVYASIAPHLTAVDRGVWDSALSRTTASRQDGSRVHRLRGDFARAVSTCRSEVAALRAASTEGAEAVFVLAAEVRLGQLLSMDGRDDEAVALARETLAKLEMVEIPASGYLQDRTRSRVQVEALVAALCLAGESLHRWGSVEQALSLARRAYTIHLHLMEVGEGPAPPAPTHPERAAIGPALEALGVSGGGVRSPAPTTYASILVSAGRPDEAREVLRRWIETIEDTPDPDPLQLADALEAGSHLHLLTGEVQVAQRLAERALASRARALGESHPETARTRLLVGDVLLHRRHAELALSHYTRALEDLLGTLGRRHPDTARAQRGRALALARAGRAAEAVDGIREAVHLLTERAVSMFQGSTRSEQLQFSAHLLDALADWLEISEAAAVPAYDEVLRVKGLVGRLVASEARVAREATGELRDRCEALQRTRRVLARLYYRRPWRNGPWLPWRRALAGVADEEARLRDQVAEAAPAYRAFARDLREGKLDPSAGLRRSEVLVDMVLCGGRYTAWVVAPRSPPVRIDLGAAEHVDEVAGRFRAAVLDAVAGNTSTGAGRDAFRGPLREEVEAERARELEDAATEFRGAVWKLIEEHLPRATRRIYLGPDGALAAVPYAAIPGRRPRTVLLEEYELRHVASAAALDFDRRAASAGRGCLLLGNVDFDRAHSEGPAITPRADTLLQRTPGAIRFAPLPGTAREIDALRGAYAAAFSGEPVHVLEAEHATEAGLRERAHGRRLVHLATHGFVRRRISPARGAPPGTEFNLRAGLERYLHGLDPLLDSGLALAGVNARTEESDRDGMLTALEASSLDMTDVDLVVLSTCDSARGAVWAGEGILGLTSALRNAGARNVVASLWAVDDDATQKLMRRFYEHLLGKQKIRSPAGAMRQAALDIRRGTGKSDVAIPVRHWAAFVVYGPGD